jgi:hypothetical protein
MLVRAIDAETLARAEQLSAEVARRLRRGRDTGFESEAEAEACLWEIVALMQQQAAVTARILTIAIDVKAAQRTAAEKA